MSKELQFMGFETTTTTGKHIHSSSFAHHKISDVVFSLLDRPMLFDAGIRRIEVKAKFNEAKKSTKPSEKSEPKQEKQSTTRSKTPLSGSIVTEQGIHINFGPAGIMSVPIGPL